MNDTVRTYNPFWPVFIVFFFFVVTSILQLISNVQAKNNLQAAVAQLSKGVTQAQAKSAALNGLARDLVDLAPSSAPCPADRQRLSYPDQRQVGHGDQCGSLERCGPRKCTGYACQAMNPLNFNAGLGMSHSKENLRR